MTTISANAYILYIIISHLASLFRSSSFIDKTNHVGVMSYDIPDFSNVLRVRPKSWYSITPEN